VALSARQEPGPAQARSLASVLTELETKFKVHFSFDSELIREKYVNAGVPLSEDLAETLAQILTPNQLRYEKVADKYYAIYREGRRRPKEGRRGDKLPDARTAPTGVLPGGRILPVGLPSDPITVAGTVTDAEDQPLVGVNVTVKGTTTGTVTDVQGRFSLAVPDEKAVLAFSFIGYVTEEVAVGNRTQLNVRLVADIQSLSEVVVVGYGTQQRRDVTGSVASVKEAEIKAVPVTGVDQALQGRAPGVQVIQNSGAPGGSVSVRVRGVGTVGNSEPLYVVDGVPFINSAGNGTNAADNSSNVNILNTLNPNDVVSIDVLKDASATAIYGARGANGVVIITTKRGQAGKPVVNFDSYYGVQGVAKRVDLLDAAEFAELNNDVLTNGGKKTNPDFANPAALGAGTDWLDEIFRPAPIQSYNLAASGGNDKTQFAISGGYFRQDGIIIGSDFKRYSVRLNLDSKLSDKIRIGNSLSISRTEQRAVTTDEDTKSGLVFLAMNQLPTLPVYRDGSYAGPEGPIEYVGDKSNPVGRALEIDNFLNRNRLLGSVYGEWDILEGLRFRTNLGLDVLFRTNSAFEPDYQWGGIRHSPATVEERASNELIWLAENTLTYTRNFGGKHALTALVGTTAQNSASQGLVARDARYPYNSVQSLNIGSGTYGAESSRDSWSLLSYIGRVNYAFADKYLFTGTVRVDGSSRFGASNRYGVFPSGSVAWRISQEGFMQHLPAVSDLKLRASYGATGNQEIGLYGYATLLRGDQNYVFNDQITVGVGPTTLPNPGVRWESVKQANVGVDLALFNDRVSLTADVFDKTTTGMLLGIPIALSSGYRSASAVNAGRVQNQGLELGLNTRNLAGGSLTWNTDFNITFIKNKVLDLSVGRPISGGDIDFNQTITRTQAGQPIGTFYGYVTDGIFGSADEVKAHATQQPGTAPGDIRFRDLNGDGIINDDDRTFIGSPIPKFTFGLTNNLAFKGFDLSVFLSGVYGNDVFNANRIFNEQMSGAFNQTTETLNRWRSPEQPGNGKMPRAVWDDPNINARTSDRYVEDGSYLRIRNLTLGYTLPQALTGTLRMSRLRVYASAQNLHTFTRYKGFDPEVGPYRGNSLQNGVNNGTYPVARVLLAGLNVSF
jgi:TonB-linked SusC/RagA family outer membrane protein